MNSFKVKCISKLRIVNFMSFVGEFDISLTHLTAINSADVVGKTHFIYAIQYVFGQSLDDYGFKEMSDLFHEYLLASNASEFLEVDAVLETHNGDLKLSRSIINGEEVFKVNGHVIDAVEYLHYTSSFRFMKLSESVFNQIMFDEDGLHNFIYSLLGFDNSLKDIRQKVKKLTTAEKLIELKNFEYNDLVKTLKYIGKEVSIFDECISKKAKEKEESLKRIKDGLDSQDSEVEISDIEMTPLNEQYEASNSFANSSSAVMDNPDFSTPDQSVNFDEGEFYEYCGEKAKLSSLKFCSDLQNAKARKITFKAIKDRLLLEGQGLQDKLANMARKNRNFEMKIQSLARKISIHKIDLEEQRAQGYWDIPTQYGQFSGRLCCGKFEWILRAVLGDIFDAHIVDTQEEATNILKFLRKIKTRRTIIILKEYSPNLKDFLFEHSKIKVNSINDVMQILYKCACYGLVPFLPSMVKRGGVADDFEVSFAGAAKNGSVLYIAKKEFVNGDGSFGRLDFDPKDNENVATVSSSLLQTLKEEEKLFYDMRDHALEVYSCRLELASIQAFIFDLDSTEKRFYCKIRELAKEVINANCSFAECFGDGINQDPDNLIGGGGIEDICETLDDELMDFEIYNVKLLEIERKLSECMKIRDIGRNREIDGYLQATKEPIRKIYKVSQNLIDLEYLAVSIQLKQIKALISEKSVEFYKTGKSLASLFLSFLSKEEAALQEKYEIDKADLDRFIQDKLELINPFVAQCNEFLDKHFQLLGLEYIGKPIMKVYGNGELSLTVASGRQTILISQIHTFFYYIVSVAISMLLAEYKKFSIVVFEDVDIFMPRSDIDVSLIFQKDDITSTRYNLISTVGNFLRSILENVSRLGNSEDPTNEKELQQILFFSNDDLVEFASSIVVIYQKEETISGRKFIFSKIALV